MVWSTVFNLKDQYFTIISSNNSQLVKEIIEASCRLKCCCKRIILNKAHHAYSSKQTLKPMLSFLKYKQSKYCVSGHTTKSLVASEKSQKTPLRSSGSPVDIIITKLSLFPSLRDNYTNRYPTCIGYSIMTKFWGVFNSPFHGFSGAWQDF